MLENGHVRFEGAGRGNGPPETATPRPDPYWTDFGLADLENLILLCWGCHSNVHERGWHVTRFCDLVDPFASRVCAVVLDRYLLREARQ
jgi:hypothetical protein